MKRFLLILGLIICGLSLARADMPTGQLHVTAQNLTATTIIKQGCWGLTLITNSSFTGSLNGGTLPVSSVIVVPVPAGGKLTDTTLTVTAGSVTTLEVR
jgi:hypothetical protein